METRLIAAGRPRHFRAQLPGGVAVLVSRPAPGDRWYVYRTIAGRSDKAGGRQGGLGFLATGTSASEALEAAARSYREAVAAGLL